MGERKQPQLLFWQGREMQWCGAESGASCQHIHMSSLLRHTLENVTSFQAWPGKGSAAVGGKSPGLWPACTKAASHRVRRDSQRGTVCVLLHAALQINDMGSHITPRNPVTATVLHKKKSSLLPV